MLKAATLGNYRGDKEVDMTVQFSGRGCVLLSNPAAVPAIGMFLQQAVGL